MIPDYKQSILICKLMDHESSVEGDVGDAATGAEGRGRGRGDREACESANT